MLPVVDRSWRHLLGGPDLDAATITRVRARARELAAMPVTATLADSPMVGTMFLTPSTRTRLGFEVAAHRLGAGVVGVSELRIDATMSGGESFDDALRVVTGMVDVLVTRTDFELDRALVVANAQCAVVNGGDAYEHPTQALIDLTAIDAFAGPLGELDVAICGDLHMRSVRSLTDAFSHAGPARLILVSPPERSTSLPALSFPVVESDDVAALEDADVLIIAGLPARRGDNTLRPEIRAEYALSTTMLGLLPPHAVILSPMPVIDEITSAGRADPRLKMFEQSDLGVFVRMAVLEICLGRTA